MLGSSSPLVSFKPNLDPILAVHKKCRYFGNGPPWIRWSFTMVGLQLLSQDWFVGGSAIRSRYRDAKPRSPCWRTGWVPAKSTTHSKQLAGQFHSLKRQVELQVCSGHSWKSSIRWPNPALFHPTAAFFFSDPFSPLNWGLDSLFTVRHCAPV